jgi:phosphoglycolate phosphatase
MKIFPLHEARDASTALFDLDGTLVDSAGDITSALNYVLTQLGAREKSIREVEPLIGLPAEHLFRDVEAKDKLPDLVANFREQLAKISGTRTIVYPGVVELLESLTTQGWMLAVATNKPTALAKIVLDRCNLLSYFGAVVGSDLLPPKPNPAILHACVLRLGGQNGGGDCPRFSCLAGLRV